MENIKVIRHLEDVDDLRTYGRDPVLVPGQEEKAKEIADELYSDMLDHSKRAILFVTSPRIRAQDTAQMVADELAKKNDLIKFRFSTTDDLRAIDQGDFILPDDYKEGDSFAGLKLAGKIFSSEVHASDTGGIDNYEYKFGDSVLLPDGSFKYPELNNYFKKPGESYREVLLRIYSLVVATCEKLDDFSGKTKLVVVTHAQPSQIFRDLIQVAKKIKNREINYETGNLARLCWDEYKKGAQSERVTGRTDTLSFDELDDPAMIRILKNEIEYLKNKK